MLIEFSVENFRSFRDKTTFSMIASRLREPQLDRDNVIVVDDKLSLLRSAAVFGANASGKSNLLTAIGAMRYFVLATSKDKIASEDRVEDPFAFQTNTADSPSSFEAVFLIEGVQYRYGFSVSSKNITAEWLYCTPTRREATLFTRENDEITVGASFREGRWIRDQKLDITDKLFLSVVALFKKEGVAWKVWHWFANSIALITGVKDINYMNYTMKRLEDPQYREQITELVSRLDLDISSLSVRQIPIDDKIYHELRSHHRIRNGQGEIVSESDFPARETESDGTWKLIGLAGPLLDVLSTGKTLLADELDSSLHPILMSAIVKLFNSPKTNPNGAQLICSIHNTDLLDHSLLRRDQIYFVEKDEFSVSRLYSLADFKLEEGGRRVVRSDASFAKNYIQGRYGAIPYLGDIQTLFQVGELVEDSERRKVTA
ncbi:hypothetical protein LBMAG21_12400 [Armatimonadota bacterium]|nr:hypothetical protein LBMAG21_12400 [Armatimonadota bacterium]